MAAAKANYVIVYKNSSQVYSTANLATAIKTPLPKGCKPEDKRILFMSFVPDDTTLCVYPLTDNDLTQEETQNDEQE
jgi:hypothetical protein